MPGLLDLQFRIEENYTKWCDFQITLRGMGRVSFPQWGRMGNYWVVGAWGVISTILTFFKAKKQHSVNIEYQLKSKLAWPMRKKSMKLKWKMVQDQWLQQRMKFLIGYYLKIVIQWGQWTFGGAVCVGGGLLGGIFASEGDFLPSPK